jgi:DNA-binding transcriptional MerR regulator
MSNDDVRSLIEGGLLPRPRRRPGRSDEFAFRSEHLARLGFIKRALALGFDSADITRLLSDGALTTCNDVYEITARRVERLRQANTPAAALSAIEQACPKLGARRHCPIVAALDGGSPPNPLARKKRYSARRRPRENLAASTIKT